MRKTSLLGAVFLGLSCAAAGGADKLVPFLRPDQAIVKMTYPDEFRVTAFAAERSAIRK